MVAKLKLAQVVRATSRSALSYLYIRTFTLTGNTLIFIIIYIDILLMRILLLVVVVVPVLDTVSP